MLSLSMADIVVSGDNEFDDEDYLPNPSLQLLANHLSVPFPICHLYSLYFDYTATTGKDFHIFTNPYMDEGAMLCIDLHRSDPLDELDTVVIGVKCSSIHVEKVRACLNKFATEAEFKMSVKLTEGKVIKYLETILERNRT